MDKTKIQKYADRLVSGNDVKGIGLMSQRADGLTIEEAFELYVYCMNQISGDEFLRVDSKTKEYVNIITGENESIV